MAKALQSDCVGEIFQARCTALRCYLTLGDGIQPLRFQPETFTRMFSAKIYTISGRLPKWLRGYKMIKLNRPTEFSRNYLAQICSKIRWFLLCHQCIVWALKKYTNMAMECSRFNLFYKYRQGQNKMSFQGWQTIPFSDDISHLIILFNVCKGKAKNEPREMQKYEEKNCHSGSN